MLNAEEEDYNSDGNCDEITHPPMNRNKQSGLSEEQTTENLFSSPSLFSPTFNRTAQSIFASNPSENPILTPPITRIGIRGMDNLNDEAQAIRDLSVPVEEATSSFQRGMTLDLNSLGDAPLEQEIVGHAVSQLGVVESPSGDTYIPLSQYDSNNITKSDNHIPIIGLHDYTDMNARTTSAAASAEPIHQYHVGRFPAASSPTNSTHSGVSEHSSFAGPCPYKHGDIVWAQTESFLPFWPGFVFIEHDKLPEHMQRMVAGIGHRRSPSGGVVLGGSSKRRKLCVYFFGKDDFDLVLESRIKDFNTHSELRYSQSHTLGPGGAIVTFLKACHLAQEELLKEPGQRVQWLSAGTTSSSILSIPVAISLSLSTESSTVDDKRLPTSDFQNEQSHIKIAEDIEDTQLIGDLKPADVVKEASPRSFGSDSAIQAAVAEDEVIDDSPFSIAEGSVEDESEDVVVANDIPIVLDGPTDPVVQKEIATPASGSESTYAPQVEAIEDKAIPIDTVEPGLIGVPDRPRPNAAVVDAGSSLHSFVDQELEQPANVTEDKELEQPLKNIADVEELERYANVADDIIIDSAVSALEVSDFRIESLPLPVTVLHQSTVLEKPSSSAIEHTDEQKSDFDSEDPSINVSVEKSNPFAAVPVISEPQFSPDRKPAYNAEEIFTNRHSSIESAESSFPASPPKGNTTGGTSFKLSPFKEVTVAVKKFAPSLTLSDASNLFGGATADLGTFGNTSHSDEDLSIFQKPVSSAMPTPKPLFPSSTSTAGNPFDSAPPIAVPLKPVSSTRTKLASAAHDASALFGDQSTLFPPAAVPFIPPITTTSNHAAARITTAKAGRVVASDASSLFGGGSIGFPDGSPPNAIPAKISSQKASAVAAADLFGPPPPSSEPALFAAPMAATAPSPFISTAMPKQNSNNLRISSTVRDPFQPTEGLPPSLAQKPKSEKTSPVPPSSDRLFPPPPQLTSKGSEDFFSSHADSNVVNTKAIPNTSNDSRVFGKAPTPALTLSLPFSTNASVTDFGPPKGYPAAVTVATATVLSSPLNVTSNSSPSQSASTFFQSTSPSDSLSQNSFGEVSSRSGDASDTTPAETAGYSKVLPTSSVTTIPPVKSEIDVVNQPVVVGSVSTVTTAGPTNAPVPPLTRKKSSGVLFHGKAQVISGASPFDFDPSGGGGQANPFAAIPAPQQQPPSLFPPTTSQSDPFSSAKNVLTPPIPNSIVANSPFRTGTISNSSGNKSVSAEGLFSAPAPGSNNKIKLKQAPASEVFNLAAPTASPASTTGAASDGAGGARDPFSPPMAPGVKPQLQKDKDRDDKADSSDISKSNSPAPNSAVGKKSSKGPGNNTSTGCPPGMMPTPHGFVPIPIPTVAKAAATATVGVPKESALIAEELFAIAGAVPPSVNGSAPISSTNSSSIATEPPKAPGVHFSRPTAPIAERKTNLPGGLQSNEYRMGQAGLQERKLNYGRPSHAVVIAFGFGGKLVTMFPKYRPPLNPLAASSSAYGLDISTGEARCYLPSALRVYRTVDLVKTSVDPTFHRHEQRNLPCPEMQLFFKLLSASETFRPDAASAEAIRGFIEERRLGRVNPLYLSVSDRYFAESDQVRLTEKRATLNTSEQLLWGLLAIMLDNGGKLSSVDSSSSELSNSSPEKMIAALLLREESPLETRAPQLATSQQDPELESKVEKLLVEGRRQDAFNLALGQGAWALALVIGSVCGAEQYQLAVRSFASTLLSGPSSVSAPLYVAAMLFSNQVTQQLATLDKNALSSWRSTLCTLLCNKGGDWKDLLTLLGSKLLQEREDVCAAHFAFLCSEIYPSVPSSPHTAGQYLLLGCDLGQGGHRSMDNVVALSALRRTETLEFILANPIYRPTSTNPNTDGIANSKSSGGLSSLFNWGGGSSNKTSTNISTIQSSTNASSKQQLDKVRAALAPLKLRFAILLADFGLTKEAAEYARGVRAIVKEADTGEAGMMDAKSTSSKNKGVSPTSSTAKHFNKHFVRALDEFCDRLGIATGSDEASSSSLKDKDKRTSSSSTSSLWSVSSMFNAISAANLKEFVDGPSPATIQPNLAQSTSSPPESTQPNLSNHQPKGPDQFFSSNKPSSSNAPSSGGGISSAYPAYSQPPPPFSSAPNQPPLPFPTNPNPNSNSNTATALPKMSDSRAVDGPTWFVGENPLPGQGTSPPPTTYQSGAIPGDGNLSVLSPQYASIPGQSFPQTFSTQDISSKEVRATSAKTAAPNPTNPAPAPAAGAAAGAATATGDANNKGLVKTLHKGLLKWLYPNAHDASGNLGDENVAYYDKATGKWVFPGQENSSAPDPASLAPPTGPIGPQSLSLMGSNPSLNSNPNLASIASAQPPQESFDPLAALIAPPSYRIPAANQSSQNMAQLGSHSSSNSNLDPLAALMAPPSANRYSAVSYPNPNNRSFGQLAPQSSAGLSGKEGPPIPSSSSSTSSSSLSISSLSGPPPKISMWVPPSAANSNFNSNSNSSSYSSFGWESTQGPGQGQGAEPEPDGMTTIDLNGGKADS